MAIIVSVVLAGCSSTYHTSSGPYVYIDDMYATHDRARLAQDAKQSMAKSDAQNVRIDVDKVDAKGFRFISSEFVNCRNGMTDKLPMSFAVVRASQGDKVDWSLLVQITDFRSFKIPQGGLMLIKLADDSIIELHQQFREWDTADIIGEYQTSAKMRTHTMKGSYEITEAQLRAIAGSTVKKIRVERDIDTFDVDYKTDKVGAAIRGGYNAVKGAASSTKSIYSDF